MGGGAKIVQLNPDLSGQFQSGSGTPTGGASGDLSGSYPAPTVGGIGGVPVDPPNGNSADYLDGTGHWTVPPGTSSSLDWIIVTDYGAVGDNTTDDTTALQAAFDAAPNGGTVYIPAGEYKITGTLTITGKNLNILGAGDEYGPSIIRQATDNTNAVIFNRGVSYSGSRNEVSLMQGLMVLGPHHAGHLATGGTGVGAYSDLNLTHVGITGFYDGLSWFGATYYSKAYACFFSSCARAGVLMSSTNNCTLDTCRITGDWGAGTWPPIGPLGQGVIITASGTGGIINRVINCSVEYFVGDGIQVVGCSDTVIANVYMESQQSSAGFAFIHAKSSFNTTIDACYLQHNTAGVVGIRGEDADNLTVRDCDIAYAPDVAIEGIANLSFSQKFLIINPDSITGTITLPVDSYILDQTNPPASLTSSVPAASAPGDTGAVGAGTTAARYNHVHGREAWGGSGDIGVLTFGATASAGSTGKEADAGHVHQMPASPGGVDHEHVMDCLFSGDGTTTAFSLPVAPFDQYSVAAYVAGVLTEVTLSGTVFDTATFGSAPTTGTDNVRFDIVAAVY